MTVSHKRGAALLDKPKNMEPATFKNSLRLWQARWKAQKEAPPEPAKDTTTTGSTAAGE